MQRPGFQASLRSNYKINYNMHLRREEDDDAALIFVHGRALSTALAYHDPVPLTLSERRPAVGLVLQQAKRGKTTVSRE